MKIFILIFGVVIFLILFCFLLYLIFKGRKKQSDENILINLKSKNKLKKSDKYKTFYVINNYNTQKTPTLENENPPIGYKVDFVDFLIVHRYGYLSVELNTIGYFRSSNFEFLGYKIIHFDDIISEKDFINYKRLKKLKRIL